MGLTIVTLVGLILVPPVNNPLPLPTTVAPLFSISGKASFCLDVRLAVDDDFASVNTILSFWTPIKSNPVFVPLSVFTVICSTISD